MTMAMKRQFELRRRSGAVRRGVCKGTAAAWVAAACLVFLPQAAQANVFKDRSKPVSGVAAGAEAPPARATRNSPRTRPAAPPERRASGSLGVRATHPVVVAGAPGPGQTGYVHFFQLVLPDGTPETQVGIELPDQRIAWSFPGLGVVVSPFVDEGMIAAGGKQYEIWHLYGIRPFPDDAAMSALQRDLPRRIAPWLAAATPYCGVDGPGQGCMSCLGFVLRALYPGRAGDYPDLPRDFWRTGSVGRYSPNDLLLYLTGMLDIPTREARLRRIVQLELPDELRGDLQELVYAMGAHESSPYAGAVPRATQKRPLARQSSRAGLRPAPRKPL